MRRRSGCFIFRSLLEPFLSGALPKPSLLGSLSEHMLGLFDELRECRLEPPAATLAMPGMTSGDTMSRRDAGRRLLIRCGRVQEQDIRRIPKIGGNRSARPAG